MNAMSMMTTAASKTYRRHGLRATMVVGLLIGTVFATGLLLLHVQLRFATDDLKRETRNLQKERSRLDNEYNQLESRLETLKTGDRILNHARELGMINYDSTQAETLKVSMARARDWLECEPAWTAGSPTAERLEFASQSETQRAEKVELFLNALRLKTDKDEIRAQDGASG
jgi:cell division protein FtsL